MDAERCADCGHLPGCACPHFCQPERPAPDYGTHADLPDPVHGGDIFARIEASAR